MKRSMRFSVLFGILSVLLTGFIIIFLPMDREVKTLGIFLLKLLPFIFAAISIALIDVDLITRLKTTFPIMVVCFLHLHPQDLFLYG